METYMEMSKRHQDEFNALPIKYAFNGEQFDKVLKEFNCKQKDLCKMYSGAFYKRTDSDKIAEVLHRHDREMKAAMKNYKFAYGAFVFEMNNHEYSYTLEIGDVLDALNLKAHEVQQDKVLLEAYKNAKEYVLMNS